MREIGRETGFFPNQVLWAVAFCLLVFPLLWIIPPFQAPDEDGHFYFADTLFSERGMIDEGQHDLSIIMDRLKFHYERKYTHEMLQKSKEIRFTGTNVRYNLYYFSDYLPVVYFPQKIGSIFARFLGYQPYELLFVAKIFNICCITAIFCLALWRGATTHMAILCMFLPMGLFQSASLSPDGMNIALTFLSAVLFTKAMRERFISSTDQIFLFLSLLLLICHRFHMFPLVFVPIFIYYKYKDKKLLFMTVFLIFIFFIWILFTALGKPVYQTGVSLKHAAFYYIKHPSITLHIFCNTFNIKYIASVAQHFIGVLGWVDAPLAIFAYKAILFLYGIVALCTVSIKRSAIALSSLFFVLGPIFCMFFIGLFAFSQFPAEKIAGVQGRYFILPAIYAAVTLFDSDRVTKYKYGNVFINSICIIAIIVSSSSVVYCLLNRYYL